MFQLSTLLKHSLELTNGTIIYFQWEIPFFGSKRLEEKRLIALTDIENNDKVGSTPH